MAISTIAREADGKANVNHRASDPNDRQTWFFLTARKYVVVLRFSEVYFAGIPESVDRVGLLVAKMEFVVSSQAARGGTHAAALERADI
jgi:hypothetical protein